MKNNINDKMYKVAEVKLTYESKVKASERYQIKSAEDAAELFFKVWDRSTIDHVEEVKLILLNRANRVLHSMVKRYTVIHLRVLRIRSTSPPSRKEPISSPLGQKTL